MRLASTSNRREFLQQSAAMSAIMAAVPLAAHGADAALNSPARMKVGVIGCGSVSQKYLPHLKQCPFVELVSVCDIIPERSVKAAERFGVPQHFSHIDQMLGGPAFDLLVNLTDMQEHERLNRQALEAGKNVWSEKPLANSLEGGQALLAIAEQRGVKIWGAPNVVQSPQFKFMAKEISKGTLGRIAAAHASYGHLGPDWAEFFYSAGGGSMPDLAVYNLTFLTGILGAAQSVVSMLSVVTPTRQIKGKGEVRVTSEDNAMVLLDHGNGVISHIQSGFNYFAPQQHDDERNAAHSIEIVGTGGTMQLAGYDWAPHGVDLATHNEPRLKRYEVDRAGYAWESGASLAAECLATGRELLMTPQHALHVVEIINAARASQETGRRIELTSKFTWPVV